MLKTIAIYAVDIHKGGKTIAIAAAIVQQRANDAGDKKSLMSANNTTKKTENYLENMLKNGYPGMISQFSIYYIVFCELSLRLIRSNYTILLLV
jgi:hypothetical protein